MKKIRCHKKNLKKRKKTNSLKLPTGPKLMRCYNWCKMIIRILVETFINAKW